MKPLLAGAILVAALGLVVGTGRGAPGPKAKDEPPGPIKEEHFEATRNNLRQIALAWHNYESANGNFPSNQLGKDRKPLLSWRVQILPYIEQDDLYKKFKLDAPWDSENNKKLIDKMPKLFAPIRVKADPGMTYYQSFVGSNALIKPGKVSGIFAITDGTSNTLMVAEAARPVIWSKLDDLPFDGKELPALGGMFDGKFHAAFCDGFVERFKKGVDKETLRRLIDPQDGEVINRDDAIDRDGEKK